MGYQIKRNIFGSFRILIYDKYGEEYIELFKKYPEALTINVVRDDQFAVIDYGKSHSWKLWQKEIEGIDKDVVWAVVIDGLSMIVDKVFSWFDLSKDEVEQIHYDAIMTLVQKIYVQNNVAENVMQEVENAFEGFDEIYSTGHTIAKSVLVMELAEKSKALSYETINEIVDSALGKDVKNIARFLGEGVTVTEYIVTAIQMYEVDCKLLDQLQKVAGKGTQLYEDIELLKKEREQNELEFFGKKFLSEAAKKAIGKVISKGTGGLYDIVTGSASALSELFVPASVQEQAYIATLAEYAATLADKKISALIDMNENKAVYIDSEWLKRIEEYEFLYVANMKALEAFYENMAEIVSYNDKQIIQEEIKNLKQYTYDEYIKCCIETMRLLEEKNTSKTTNVTAKMDQLYNLLGNKYCTVNQKACESSWESGHGCTNCNMSDIVQTKWFKNIFGTVNVKNFPKHDVDATRRDRTGQSCFGFACFAQWYIYADSNTEEITAERIAAVDFNKTNMEKYVQPGDIVRVNGHSVLVYSIEKDGLMVIDCNWGYKGQLNCLVQKHLLEYNHSWYAGHTAYINRVTGTTTGSSGGTTNTDANKKTQYGYYHYTNGKGEYSVCAHYGAEEKGWTDVYREEIWVDEPLKKVASDYRHIRLDGCDEIGCMDDEWTNGGKYEDEYGVIWYRQVKKSVDKSATETQTFTVICEGIGTPEPTATPRPTVTPKPTATPKPTQAPKATATPTPKPEPVESGWVRASDCPAGATIVDTKWTYTYTERTESTSATKSGWTRDGERKEVVASGTFDYAAFPDTFDTSHAVYNSMYTSKNAVPVAEGATREVLSDAPAGYVYWHYAYPVDGGGDARDRIVGYYYNQNLKYVGSWCYATEFCAFKSAKNYTTKVDNKEGGGKVYKITDSGYVKYDVAKGSHWWYRFEYNTCTYQDVKTVYQYYRTTEKESKTEVFEGNGNSNVVKWVRYK